MKLPLLIPVRNTSLHIQNGHLEVGQTNRSFAIYRFLFFQKIKLKPISHTKVSMRVAFCIVRILQKLCIVCINSKFSIKKWFNLFIWLYVKLFLYAELVLVWLFENKTPNIVLTYHVIMLRYLILPIRSKACSNFILKFQFIIYNNSQISQI